MAAPSTGEFATIAKAAAGMHATMRDRIDARLAMEGLKLDFIHAKRVFCCSASSARTVKYGSVIGTRATAVRAGRIDGGTVRGCARIVVHGQILIRCLAKG